MEKTKTRSKEPRLKIGKYNVSRIRESLELYVLLALPVVFLFFMSYAPMPGIAVAFQDFKLGQKGFFGEHVKWVGLKHFKAFIEGKYFERLMGNTLRISFKSLLLNFPIPIIFALLLNEVKHLRTKKFIQTASYLPHFISSVVVAGMVVSFVETNGLITTLLNKLFNAPNQNWLSISEAFDTVYICTVVWVGFGFSSILYMSAISGVDQELYEAARLDGATRWQQVWYITLPGILPTISICLIMDLGAILGTNTDLILNMYNTGIFDKADCIGTYVYRMGLGVEGSSGLPKYSATAAIGLFSAVINITMLFIANKLSNWLTDTGLW